MHITVWSIAVFFLVVAWQCDLRYVQCDLRYVQCDLRCAQCDLRYAQCDLRYVQWDLRYGSGILGMYCTVGS